MADDLVVDKIMDLVDTRAKTRRANHGAVCAGEASIGDILPMRVIQPSHQRIPELIGRQTALDALGNALDRLIASLEQSQRSLGRW